MLLKLAKYRSCYCNLCRYGHSHEGWPKIEARESRHMTERYVFRRYLSAADVSSSLNYFGPFGVSWGSVTNSSTKRFPQSRKVITRGVVSVYPPTSPCRFIFKICFEITRHCDALGLFFTRTFPKHEPQNYKKKVEMRDEKKVMTCERS